MLLTENSCSAGALCKGGKTQVHVMGMGEVKPLLSPVSPLAQSGTEEKCLWLLLPRLCSGESWCVCSVKCMFLERNTNPVPYDSEVARFAKSDATILNMSVPAFWKVPAARDHCPQGEVLVPRALGHLLWQCLQYPEPSMYHMEAGGKHTSHFADGKWHLRFFVQVTELNQVQK